VTTTPTQALLMLNSPFMQQQAQAFAARLLKEAPANDEGRIDAAFRLVFGRAATVQQKEQVRAFLAEQAKRLPATAEAPRAVLAELCLVLLNANEFVYVD
jgi:hypothetical protein